MQEVAVNHQILGFKVLAKVLINISWEKSISWSSRTLRFSLDFSTFRRITGMILKLVIDAQVDLWVLYYHFEVSECS